MNPGLARLAFSDADVQHGPTFRHLIMQLMLAVAGWNRIDRGLVDEAPIARLAWFFARHPGVDIGTWAPRIAERLPTGDVTVWLTCDPEVAWARYIQRDDPATLRDYDDEAIRASYDRYQQAAGLVLTGPLVKVDTTHSPPDDVAERIVAALG